MVETSRLKIIPLSYRQLVTYLQAGDRLERELGLVSTNRIVAADVKELLEEFTVPRMKIATPENYYFYTFWIVVDKVKNCIVAELGFKGEPNYKKEIEIGYGTFPAFRGLGYMKEAVGAMITWAEPRHDVQSILAETDKNNAASIKVVLHNQFIQFDKRGDMLWWVRKVPGP